MVVKDVFDQAIAVIEDPDLKDLPDWVARCYIDNKFFMTCDDDYSGLWVALPIELPYEHDEKGIAIRADPSSLLLYDESEGYIRILAEID